MAGPLELIGQGLGAVGGAARGAARAMFPGAALNADFARDQALFQNVVRTQGLDSEAAKIMATNLVNKYKTQKGQGFTPAQFTSPRDEAYVNYMNTLAGRTKGGAAAAGPTMTDYRNYAQARDSLALQLEDAQTHNDTAAAENLTRTIGRLDQLMQGGATPGAPPPTGPLAQIPAPPPAPPAAGETPQQETMAGAMTKAYRPLAGITPTPQGLNAFYGYDYETARQRQRLQEQQMAEAEATGGVTANNVERVVRARTGTKRGLAAADRAIASYMQSPAYAQAITKGARPLDPNAISGQMKELLARESVANRNRLLQMIHERGEEAVRAAIVATQSGGR